MPSNNITLQTEVITYLGWFLRSHGTCNASLNVKLGLSDIVIIVRFEINMFGWDCNFLLHGNV